MPIYDQKTKIKGWYVQSLQEQFNPFIKLWIAFNGWYKDKFPDARTDKNSIDRCKQDGELLSYYQRSFSKNEFCNHLNILGSELDKKPLENLTRPQNKKLRFNKMADINQEGEQNVHFLDNSPEAFGMYLDVIYRVRCNLF
ncbi:MAG: hypothetical protein HQ538_06715, partial [Parcubacteria group bacterium]|nr:hypothetical protein [Parcubacteria group bacterium]